LPRYLITKILKLAPEAARLQDYDGNLPLHIAFLCENVEAVELLTTVYLRGLFVMSYTDLLPFDVVYKSDDCAVFNASTKGLIAGLSNDASSYTELETISGIILKHILVKYDDNTIDEFLISKFIETYEKKDGSDIRKILLRLYLIVTATDDTIHMSSCLQTLFGSCAGDHSVEYKLLNIITLFNKCDLHNNNGMDSSEESIFDNSFNESSSNFSN